MKRYTGILIGSSAVMFLAANCAPASGTDTRGGPAGGRAPAGGAAGSPSTGGTTPTGGSGMGAAGGVSATAGSSPVGSGGSVTASGGSGGTGGGPAPPGSGTAGASPGGSAGSGGAAASGGVGGAGPAVACPNGVVACDDFESYPAMAAPPTPNWKSWTVGAATLTVDTAHAFSGTKAAHVHGQVSQSGGSKQQAFMLWQKPSAFPVSGTTIYIRFMIYGTRFPFTAFTGPNHTVYSWVGTTKGLTSPDQGDPGKVYGLADYNGVSIEPEWNGYYRDTSVHFKDTNQANQWHCWEYEIDNAGGPPPGASGPAMPHIWEDGVELKLAEAGASAPYNAITFEAVEFGMYSPQTDSAVADYWFDDVAVSKSRINCPPAK